MVSTCSVGAWNEPTFSAREWRRATLEALGANGSWTSTTSIGSAVSTSSIVLATSTGSDAARRRVGANGSTPPTPSTRGSGEDSSSSGSERISLRVAPTSSSDWDGAMIST